MDIGDVMRQSDQYLGLTNQVLSLVERSSNEMTDLELALMFHPEWITPFVLDVVGTFYFDIKAEKLDDLPNWVFAQVQFCVQILVREVSGFMKWYDTKLSREETAASAVRVLSGRKNRKVHGKKYHEKRTNVPAPQNNSKKDKKSNK